MRYTVILCMLLVALPCWSGTFVDDFEDGDLEEALNAASAVGDDQIQKQYQGYVVPDSFTHGTSEQRQRWFFKGFRSGTLEEGDTFNTDDL